jgi:hypothetical protein
VEGVEAQKAIEEIGDPDKGKKGYPLASSCQRVIRMAWGNQSMDLADGQVSVLRAQVNRYPARTIFLVTKLTPAPDEGKKAAEEEKELPSISVPGEKQAGVKIAGPTSQPAPFWAPEGGLAKCKVIIDEKTEEILGVHIIHPEATEMIGEASVIKSHEGVATSVFNTVHAHPTLSEALMEAMGDALGRAIHI